MSHNQRYCAFLRAINVGGRTVKMEALRQLFTAWGLQDVQSYIQTGNLIFETAEPDRQALERDITDRLATELGYDVPTMLRTGPELAQIAATYPFALPKTADHVVYVSFLTAEPDPERAKAVNALEDGIMRFQVVGREVYWLRDKTAGESKIINATLEKMLEVDATRRNMNTVEKIVKKYFG